MKTKLLTMLFALVALAGQAKEKTIVWEQPTIEYNNYCGDGAYSLNLDVTRVELKAAETLVYITMKRSVYPENWFRFVSDTYLKVGDKRYTVVSADGIELDKQEYGGKRDIVFHFPPLPKGTKVFDFIEGDGEGAFQIKGIKPVEERWKQFFPSYWRNERTGDWDIAFLEDFVIYDGQFWNYMEKPDVNKPVDNAKFTIWNESGWLNVKIGKDEFRYDKPVIRCLDVKVGKDKQGKRIIQIDTKQGKKEVYSMITDRFLPDYPTKDMSTEFHDNAFRQGDSVTIVGAVLHSKEKMDNVHIVSYFTDLYEGSFLSVYDEKIPLDSLGRFQVTIPVVNLQTIALSDWDQWDVIVEPGETYFMLWDKETGQQLVMGKNARLQNELFAHHVPSKSDTPEKRDSITANDIVNYMDVCKACIRTDLAAVDSVCQANPTLSERFRIQAENIARSGAVSWLIYRCMDCMENDTLPAAAVDFINDELLRHLNTSLLATERINYPLSYYTNLLEFFTPTKRITNSASSEEEAREMFMMAQITPFYEYIKGMKVDSFIKSLMFARQMNKWMDERIHPLPNAALTYVDELVTVPTLHECVMQVYQKFVELRNQQFTATRSLRSADEVEGIDDGEALLAKLIEPYRGKFVYLDIWGSWCGPCKAALKESHELKDALKDHDIVYLYLANETSDEEWKNVIKAYNLTGDNIVHYNLPAEQQRAIEEFLQVDGFPYYKIFDKEGKLYDINADARNVGAMKIFFNKVDKKEK